VVKEASNDDVKTTACREWCIIGYLHAIFISVFAVHRVQKIVLSPVKRVSTVPIHFGQTGEEIGSKRQ